MKVMICSVLHSYTGGEPVVEAAGTSVAALLEDLERRYPGIRFRIVDEQGGLRPYMRIFVNRCQAMRLDAPLGASDEVHILQALAGG